MKMIAAVLGLFLIASVVQAQDIKQIRPLEQKLDPQLACLVRNIYHESRGEPLLGQVAVGIVTLQRVYSKNYPDTVCKVVYSPKAFSWTAKPHPKEDPEVFYGICLSAARQAILAKALIPDEFTADHYHNLTVHPYWADSKTMIAQIGNHKFYK